MIEMTDGITRFAVVRFRREGFHNWPGAEGRRAYLAQRHRHLFHVEVKLEVWDNEREVEYHDLLEYCTHLWDTELGREMGGLSCESMAHYLLAQISRHFGEKRRLSVSVFEDGEVGAVLTLG